MLLFLFILISHCLEYDSVFASGELRCKAKEREALLRFKKGLIHGDNIPSLWGSKEDKKECCEWEGITCHNKTGHVIGLQLSGNGLRGKISSVLLELSYLNHLDLSYNDFGNDSIPEFIGYLEKLQHLNLRSSYFSTEPHGEPHQLRNLRNLRTLDLSYNNLEFKNLEWLSNLSSLSLLDLTYSQLRDTNFLQNILKLPSLTELYLGQCQISNIGPISSSLFNRSTNLRSIDMSSNYLSVFPGVFGRFALIECIILSYNMLSEPLPKLFSKLSVGANDSVKILELDGNQFSGSFPDNIGWFSKLEYLGLSYNQITGPLPDLSALVSLKELHLSHNKLKTLFARPWQLPMLEVLNVGFNSLEGTISDAHLSKLQNLKVLDLSYNSLLLNFNIDWIPPFQLNEIHLAYCEMGPRFPMWLRTQTNFSLLDLSSSGISDEVPKWLWDLSPKMIYLNLSHGQISGTVPDLYSLNLSDVLMLDISYNNFSGHLPLFHPNSLTLQLNNNMFLGPISSICTIKYDNLKVLDLSNNQFFGELPNCWDNMIWLAILNLNNNALSGHIPRSFGSLGWVQALHLRDNNFSGGLPSTLKNCRSLSMIDAGGNKLTGNIPGWIGTHLEALKFLMFGHNKFYGAIPPEICYLDKIQILDLSRNFLSGTIPRCFNNFTSLVQKNQTVHNFLLGFSYANNTDIEFIDEALVQWKGQQAQYRRTLGLLKLIDLSSNRLVGNIPREFSDIRALISLNLSRNNLSGNIVSDIGQMEMLECLDLSRNKFSGEIPIGLAELHFLAVLDLSNNSLSGKIPSSAQLQSFNASTYAQNNELCGPPLPVCHGDGSNIPTSSYKKQDETGNGIITFGFIISIVLGFILGFWGVVGTLIVRNSWRNAYFNFFNSMKDWFSVTILYILRESEAP